MTDHTSIFDQPIPNNLVAEIASLSSRAVSADFLVLVEALKSRFGSSLEAVLLYGSCLRSDDLGDGLVDFYAIVNSHGKAYPRRYLGYRKSRFGPNWL